MQKRYTCNQCALERPCELIIDCGETTVRCWTLGGVKKSKWINPIWKSRPLKSKVAVATVKQHVKG